MGGPNHQVQRISNRLTVKQCVEKVRKKYPTANGFSTTTSCRQCICWAEFNMTGWNPNAGNRKKYKACKFNDRGKHYCDYVRPLCNYCATILQTLSNQSD